MEKFTNSCRDYSSAQLNCTKTVNKIQGMNFLRSVRSSFPRTATHRRSTAPGQSAAGTQRPNTVARTVATLGTCATLVGVSVAGCTYNSEGAGTSDDPTETISVPKDDAIADSLPAALKQKGTFTVGTSADFAPLEFIGNDGKTIEGAEIDMAKAVGDLFGLTTQFTNASFDSLVASVGTKYDAGFSSFDVKPERLEHTNMVTLYTSGTKYSVLKDNPRDIDPSDICGDSVAVLTGSVYEEMANDKNDECKHNGKKGVTIQSYKNSADVATAVAGGKADLWFSDSPVVDYAEKQSKGRVQPIGKVVDSTPKAAIVAKNDTQLADAIHAAIQKLIDDGTMKKILTKWGTEDSFISESQLNPKPDDDA